MKCNKLQQYYWWINNENIGRIKKNIREVSNCSCYSLRRSRTRTLTHKCSNDLSGTQHFWWLKQWRKCVIRILYGQKCRNDFFPRLICCYSLVIFIAINSIAPIWHYSLAFASWTPNLSNAFFYSVATLCASIVVRFHIHSVAGSSSSECERSSWQSKYANWNLYMH